MNDSLPRITFGMIVLNGEPFVRYNLRALYPFAHQIIIVEGAAPAAVNIATPDGHSTDTTLETIRRFQAEQDPEDKIILVTAEDDGYSNGFWPGEKNEQSRAYASRATGDYLWQVDVDEFYLQENMEAILRTLLDDPSIATVSFNQITFWGDFNFTTNGWYLHRGWCAQGIHRIFRWAPGYRYVAHRPPTVHDAQARDLRTLHWIDGPAMARKGIVMYHYSLLFPRQVAEKSSYYGSAAWAERSGAQQWFEDNFLQLKNPYRVHNVYSFPSWLERFRGKHPPQIEAMRQDIAAGRLVVDMRKNADIEKLLKSPAYVLGRYFLKAWDGVDLRTRTIRRLLRAGAGWLRQLPARAWHKAKHHVKDNELIEP